jgi:Domain of unknown function (DUF4214)
LIGVGAAQPLSNPIDDPTFFVTQHYLDFLDPTPDAGGLTFWTNQITNRVSNVEYISQKRPDVAMAFFLSTEFQATALF